jgi:uncharacterized protein YcfJ
MHKSLVLIPVALLGTGLHAAEPQEVGKVISSKPVIYQTQIPQQICGNTPIAVTEPKTGAGATLGALAGGVVGNAVGQGSGNAAATALGIVGGAVLGDRLEGQNTVVQNTTTCTTQMVTQNVTVYEVEYEYAGKRYKAQLPSDPGKTIAVSVSPALTMPPEAYPAPMANAPITTSAQPGVVMQQVAPAPVYVAPYPYYGYPYGGYPYGYYPPFSIQFGIGYYHGYRGYRR